MRCQKTSIAIAVSLALGCVGNAHADQASDMQAKLDVLQREIQELQAELRAVREKQDRATAVAAAAPLAAAALVDGVNDGKEVVFKVGGGAVQAGAPPAPAPGAAPALANGVKPGKEVIFKVGGGEVQIYGHADVSFDDQTNGMAGYLNGGVPVTGHNGWVPDVSSNLSYFGVRGDRTLSDDLKGVFQVETEIAYAATPGASDQATDTTVQKFELGSRNSFVGLQSATYGAIKLGKTDTPYKISTARMDPFASTPGDYNAIMGNSGGDNRTEFDFRAPHSVWYESPKIDIAGANVHANFQFSPGQNRSTDTGLYAMGEPDCTAGNSTAGLNGNAGQPTSCEDGSFNGLYSVDVTYESGPLYAIVAYELHKDVNRIGDEVVPGTIGIRDEYAYKLGAQYRLPTDTTVNFVVERMQRDAITDSLDERTRTSTWLALTQGLTRFDDLNLGWAHAGRTPGQPVAGVQDKFGNPAPAGSSNNEANLYTIGLKHRFLDRRTTAYLTYSSLVNGYWGHFSLGAGGHGLPTRNYVGDKFVGGCQAGGNCGPPFAGNNSQGISFGMTHDF